jgi:hypothetical protein
VSRCSIQRRCGRRGWWGGEGGGEGWAHMLYSGVEGVSQAAPGVAEQRQGGAGVRGEARERKAGNSEQGEV